MYATRFTMPMKMEGSMCALLVVWAGNLFKFIKLNHISLNSIRVGKFVSSKIDIHNTTHTHWLTGWLTRTSSFTRCYPLSAPFRPLVVVNSYVGRSQAHDLDYQIIDTNRFFDFFIFFRFRFAHKSIFFLLNQCRLIRLRSRRSCSTIEWSTQKTQFA